MYSRNRLQFEDPYLNYKTFYEYLLSIKKPYLLLDEIKRGLLQLPREVRGNFRDSQEFSSQCTELFLEQVEANELCKSDLDDFLTDKQKAVEKKIVYYQSIVKENLAELKVLEKTKPATGKLNFIREGEFYSYLWMVGGILLSTSLCGICCAFFPMATMPMMGNICALLVATHAIFFLTCHLSLKFLGEMKNKHKDKQDDTKINIREKNKNIDHYQRKLQQHIKYKQFLYNLATKLKTRQNVKPVERPKKFPKFKRDFGVAENGPAIPTL